MHHRAVILGLLAGLSGLVACRGSISEKPPIHPVLDMDFQQKIKAQSAFEFANWKDGRGMRMPVEGTVARGTLEAAQLSVFKNSSGDYLANPLPASAENFARGRERFNIYCAVCHDRAGAGKGVALQRAPRGAFNPQVPSLAEDERLRSAPDGNLYETIANGRGTMPAYGHMVTPEDRWCIVWYLRALQNRIIEK